ncbi:MAG: Cof-type HAD-IIB family hydrolase [Synergistaceae bacterium]|nr:Cof-type HAD-IIB family hydrolase [Synergistaceae bacterium]
MKFKPKAIAVDIDGTILNSRSEMTSSMKNSLRRAVIQGIPVIICTGRMYLTSLPFINEIGTTAPGVFYNGGYVRDLKTGKTIYKRGLGFELTREILDFYRENKWYIQLYQDDKFYVVDANDLRCRYYVSISHLEPQSLGKDFWEFRADAAKLLGIASDKSTIREMLLRTREHFGDRIYLAKSWGAFAEMVHPSVNKAHGLDMAANFLGIDRKDVLAIGDAGNDIEMIRWAGVGVAMKNAPDIVKDAADIVTPEDNDHDGAAWVIENYLD